MITKEMISFYVLPEKKESLDKDKSIKILTFSSQPHSPCFHVVNVKRTAVTNRKCVKLLTNQVVTRVTRRIFAVLSLLPSCCVRSLIDRLNTSASSFRIAPCSTRSFHLNVKENQHPTKRSLLVEKQRIFLTRNVRPTKYHLPREGPYYLRLV